MKKFITIILALSSVMAMAQPITSKKITLASASTTNGSAHTHYAQPVSWAAPYSLQFAFTKDQVVKTDSFTLTFEGSIDNVTWYNYILPATPVTAAGANTTMSYSSTTGALTVSATNSGLVYAGGTAFYAPTGYLLPPYFRATVTHTGATGTVTTTGYLYVKN